MGEFTIYRYSERYSGFYGEGADAGHVLVRIGDSGSFTDCINDYQADTDFETHELATAVFEELLDQIDWRRSDEEEHLITDLQRMLRNPDESDSVVFIRVDGSPHYCAPKDRLDEFLADF